MSAQKVIGFFEDDGIHFRLTEPFNFSYGWWIAKKLHHEIPAGFITDFASIPRFFWRIIPKSGRHRDAAVIHDWFYSTGILSRKEADLAFKYYMIKAGVPAWKVSVMYRAVRWFGRSAWKKHRKENP